MVLTLAILIVGSIGSATSPAGAAIQLPILGSGTSSTQTPTPPPTADPGQMSRVRLRLETTSDWAGMDLAGVGFALRRVTYASPGVTVRSGPTGFSISGPTPAAAEVLAVLDVPYNAQPSVLIRRGWIGAARGIVYRVIGSENVTVADLSTSRQSSDPTVSSAVARSNLVGPGLTIAKIDGRPLVLAFYYPWFKDAHFQSGQWWEKPTSDADTFNPVEVRAMVDKAAAYGIDGFVVSRHGQQDNTERYELVRAAAKARGNFLVVSMFELGSTGQPTPLGSDPNRVEALISDAAGKTPDSTSLMVGGRPVVFLYGLSSMRTADWAVIRSDLRSSGVDPFFVADTNDDRYGVQGTFRYSPNGFESDALSHDYVTSARHARLRPFVFPSVTQMLWAATVSPGMNDSYTRPFSNTVEPRDAGARYDETWNVALGSRPEWVLITSWNEWYEATHIQEGTRTGSRALSQTQSWSSRFGG